MPVSLDNASNPAPYRPSVGIVGTGIAALGAAHRLHPHADLTLFESAGWVGGHSHTVDATVDCTTVPVDTGFIVYNQRTYPRLTKLFEEIHVATEASDMSFSVVGDVEYEGSVPGLFSDRRLLFDRSHHVMIRDILKFNKAARVAAHEGLDSHLTLGQFVAEYSDAFRDRYLYPMGAAIWSTSAGDMVHYPAAAFVSFFSNHGLLDLRDRPQWRTVTGGSRQYVTKLIQPFRDRILLNTPVTAVDRTREAILVSTADGEVHTFDYLVMASHANTSLELLGGAATAAEKEILSSFNYSSNTAVLHTDPSFMPRSRRAWASWNVATGRPGQAPSVTYWMNRLQNLDTPRPLFVTLNPHHDPRGELGSWNYDHPLFDLGALAAQPRLGEIQLADRIAFGGAYVRYGFHEDGLLGGYQAADSILAAMEGDALQQSVLDSVVA